MSHNFPRLLIMIRRPVACRPQQSCPRGASPRQHLHRVGGERHPPVSTTAPTRRHEPRPHRRSPQFANHSFANHSRGCGSQDAANPAGSGLHCVSLRTTGPWQLPSGSVAMRDRSPQPGSRAPLRPAVWRRTRHNLSAGPPPHPRAAASRRAPATGGRRRRGAPDRVRRRRARLSAPGPPPPARDARPSAVGTEDTWTSLVSAHQLKAIHSARGEALT